MEAKKPEKESFEEFERRVQFAKDWQKEWNKNWKLELEAEHGRRLEVEAEYGRLEKIDQEQRRMEKLLNPSPNPGSPRYLEAKQLFVGRLYRCLKCGYDANLDPGVRCGMCWLSEGFSGPF